MDCWTSAYFANKSVSISASVQHPSSTVLSFLELDKFSKAIAAQNTMNSLANHNVLLPSYLIAPLHFLIDNKSNEQILERHISLR